METTEGIGFILGLILGYNVGLWLAFCCSFVSSRQRIYAKYPEGTLPVDHP